MTLDEELLIAVQRVFRDRVRDLVAAGADINARCDDGASPLFHACLSGDLETVRLLLDLGADANLEAEGDAAGIYAPKPLDLVMQAQALMDWEKYTPIFELLLARGATDCDGKVPTVADTETRRRRSLERLLGIEVKRPWWRIW